MNFPDNSPANLLLGIVDFISYMWHTLFGIFVEKCVPIYMIKINVLSVTLPADLLADWLLICRQNLPIVLFFLYDKNKMFIGIFAGRFAGSFAANLLADYAYCLFFLSLCHFCLCFLSNFLGLLGTSFASSTTGIWLQRT